MRVQVIALALAGALLVGAGESGPPEDGKWSVYEHELAGIRVRRPTSWATIVAEERNEPSASWEPEILLEGELHKITFREGEGAFFPGQYQVRVVSNPDSLPLDAFLAHFDLSDLWNDTLGDTVIVGVPAKTWVRWSYDSLTREFLMMTRGGAVHILYDEHNPNDPDFAEHQRIYAEMTSTLRVLPEGDETERR
jgi:hypothetical protein